MNISLNGYGGEIDDFRICENRGEAMWVKSFCAPYSACKNVFVDSNHIENAGVGISKDENSLYCLGAYAVFIYNSTAAAAGISVFNNTITNLSSCCIYAVGEMDRLRPNGNVISGQADKAGASIQKGAIVVSNPTRVEIIGGRLRDNTNDVVIVGSSASSDCGVEIGGLKTSGGSETASILIEPSVVSAQATGLTIRDCDLSHQGRGIGLAAKASGHGWGRVLIRGNRIAAPQCINLSLSGSAPNTGPVTVSGNRPRGSLYGLVASGLTTGPITTLGNTVVGPCSAQLLSITGSTVRLEGNSFVGQPTGSTLELSASVGSAFGNTFSQCARPMIPNLVTEFGARRPTFSGRKGQRFQNFRGAEDGKAPILGWINGGGTIWRAVEASGGDAIHEGRQAPPAAGRRAVGPRAAS